MDGSNPFEVINVDIKVTDEQVQAQYRRLVFEHHPDRNPGDPHATARMQAINAAFGQICTAEKRAASVERWLPFFAKKLLVSMADALESNMTSLQRAQDRTAIAYAYGDSPRIIPRWEIEHVPRLVHLAALHHGTVTEYGAQRFANAFAPVDDEERGLVDPKASLDEVLQETRCDDGVLGRADPEPERHLRAVLRHAERDDHGLLRDLDAVEEHRDELDIVELSVEELGQLFGRLLHERTTCRALARTSGLDVLRQGLEAPGVSSGRHAENDLLGDTLGNGVRFPAGRGTSACPLPPLRRMRGRCTTTFRPPKGSTVCVVPQW